MNNYATLFLSLLTLIISGITILNILRKRRLKNNKNTHLFFSTAEMIVFMLIIVVCFFFTMLLALPFISFEID